MRFRTPLQVRFRDLDALGHVNNAVYLTYFENARVAYWRELTGPDRPLEFPFLVARAEVDFRATADMGTPLVAELALSKIGRTSFTFDYRIVRDDTGSLVAEGRTVQVWLDAAGVPTPVPDWIRERVAELEAAPGL